MTAEDMLAVIRKQIRHSAAVVDLSGRASALDARATALAARAEHAENRLAALETITRFRTAIVTLPELASGANEIAVEWPVPFAAADYGVTLTVEAGNVALGRLTAGLKANSRTATGCTVVITNSAAVAIPAGLRLHALSWRTPFD